MNWFRNASTRAKLVLSFGLLVLLMAVVVATAYMGIGSIQVALHGSVESVELKADINRQRARMFELLAAKKDDREHLVKDIRDGALEVDESLRKMFNYVRDDPSALRELEEFKELLRQYRDTREKQIALILADKSEDARKQGGTDQDERFEKMRKISLALGDEAEADAKQAAKVALLTLVIVSVVALLIGVVLVAVLTRLIASPLAAVTLSMDRVGRGDLTEAVRADASAEVRRDEVGKVGSSLGKMVVGLREMAGQIQSVTQTLNATSAEIMASAQQQAAGTKEQAATVQEITTTMEEVSQSGAQISGKAKQVAAAAEATSAASTAGLQAVLDTNRTMGSIREQVEEVAGNIVALSEKTQAVGDIIATVNDIAERSNLLALNAAIEAASAGTQGNRFSVVANEMKNLADQAKESTVQVRNLLGEIQKGINTSVMFTEEAVKRVEAGKQQADVAEQTIRQMAKMTLESVQAFEQIIGAGNQQQIGFEQVAQGMKDIRQAAGQTASATAQLETAVANLNTLGLELKKAVGRYQL